VLPVLRPDGSWVDDFSQTGVSEPGYVVSAGAVDKMPGSIKLRATGATSGRLNLPSWFKAADFMLEYMIRRIAGANAQCRFRIVDGANLWYAELTSTALTLRRVVGGTTTAQGSATISGTEPKTIGILAIGNQIEVYLDGRHVIAVNDSSNRNGNTFDLTVWDSVAGTAQSEFQYLYIKPL